MTSIKKLNFKRKYSRVNEKLAKHLSALSKKCFRKSNLVHLYKVIENADGTICPVYTAKPRSNFKDERFPSVANYNYIIWLSNLRKDLCN